MTGATATERRPARAGPDRARPAAARTATRAGPDRAKQDPANNGRERARASALIAATLVVAAGLGHTVLVRGDTLPGPTADVAAPDDAGPNDAGLNNGRLEPTTTTTPAGADTSTGDDQMIGIQSPSTTTTVPTTSPAMPEGGQPMPPTLPTTPVTPAVPEPPPGTSDVGTSYLEIDGRPDEPPSNPQNVVLPRDSER